MKKSKTLGKGLLHLEGFAVFSLLGEGKTLVEVWDVLDLVSLSKDDVLSLAKMWVKAGLLKRDVQNPKKYWYSVRGAYVRRQFVSVLRVMEGLE